MPLQATSGAATYDAFGGGVPVVPAYIEEVFSTYLYTGNGSTQTITNGIDLSGKGGLVWTKARSAADDSRLFDTSSNSILSSSLTNAKLNGGNSLVPTYVTFNTDGFYTPNDYGGWNTNGTTYVSWTFRKQPKFFDVVTYTGNGTAGRTIAHNLNATVGCIIVKCTSASTIWSVYHRSTGATKVGILNGDNSFATVSAYWNDTEPTSTVFTVGASGAVNDSGQTYVAYLFAHDAGGFGLTGTDNVISCGSYAGSGAAGNAITLGYEPQWLLVKNTASGQEWGMFDNMRGLVNGSGGDAQLFTNTAGAEGSGTYFRATATGFACEDASARYNDSGYTYVYIAIRRGPMKVPTSGTSVFLPIATSSSTNPLSVTTNFPVDLSILRYSPSTSQNYVFDRLRGASSTSGVFLKTNDTTAETTANTYTVGVQSNTSVIDYGFLAGNSTAKIYWNFRRAPNFFDEVCYTGNSVQGRTITHNLGVKPELMFVKSRSNAISWQVYSATETATKYMLLDSSQSSNTASFDWNNTEPTSSVFTIQGTGGTGLEVNWTGYTYVAYLFATCAGVSKVGSYTGTGTTKQIDCGFTGGARFVLIKRTDSTGDWYVWDSARGIVSGNDPYLLLNSAAAEVTNTDYVDTYSAGFEISSTAPAAINASGGTFIFLAIA